MLLALIPKEAAMQWIIDNREFLNAIVTLLAGGLAVYLSLRVKYEKNWKAAFAAAFQAAVEMAKLAIEGAEEDVVKDVAGEVWDLMIKGSFLATFWNKERFTQFVWAAWLKLVQAEIASGTRLSKSGRVSLSKLKAR